MAYGRSANGAEKEVVEIEIRPAVIVGSTARDSLRLRCPFLILDQDQVIVSIAANKEQLLAVRCPGKIHYSARFKISDLRRSRSVDRLVPDILDTASVREHGQRLRVRRPCVLIDQVILDLLFDLTESAISDLRDEKLLLKRLQIVSRVSKSFAIGRDARVENTAAFSFIEFFSLTAFDRHSH